MSDDFKISAAVRMPPPRDPEELRARALALLKARVAQILTDRLRDRRTRDESWR